MAVPTCISSLVGVGTWMLCVYLCDFVHVCMADRIHLHRGYLYSSNLKNSLVMFLFYGVMFLFYGVKRIIAI